MNNLVDIPFKRTIRSFVRREGRMTPGQVKAYEDLMADFGLPEGDLKWEQVFGNEANPVMEIGFGNGATLLEMAKAAPEKNFVGIEVHRPGVGHLLKGIAEAGVKNIRVSSRDAIDVLREQVPDQSLSKLQLFFPDPWHKKKHHKRRIVQASFLNLVAQKLKPGGIIHMATDWEPYAEHMMTQLEQTNDFVNQYPETGFAPVGTDRLFTKFEARGHRLGHGVWDLIFKRA